MLLARFLVFWLSTRYPWGRVLDGGVALLGFAIVAGTLGLVVNLLGVGTPDIETGCAVIGAVVAIGVLLVRDSRLGKRVHLSARAEVVRRGGTVSRH